MNGVIGKTIVGANDKEGSWLCLQFSRKGKMPSAVLSNSRSVTDLSVARLGVSGNCSQTGHFCQDCHTLNNRSTIETIKLCQLKSTVL